MTTLVTAVRGQLRHIRPLIPVVPAADAVTTSQDAHLRLLGPLALVGLVIYQAVGWAGISLALPSLPILAAVAGALVAASVDRSSLNPWPVLAGHVRRLLAPLWVLALVVVPVMLVRGWTYDDRLGTGSALTWRTVLLWLVPLSGPPGSAWGLDWTTPLWFLSACLWLVLGTPALLWLYRRWPLRTVALPLLSLLATTASVWTLSGRSGEVLLNLMVYAPAWLVGFAHHDNRIRVLPRVRVAGIALALMATGLYYALTHQDPESGWDIAGIPLAHSLWGTGVVLLLMRLDGLGSGLAARPRLGRIFAVVNARAVTAYLWTNPAITLAALAIGAVPATRTVDTMEVLGPLQLTALSGLLVVLAVLLLGRVEDLASRPDPGLWPLVRRHAKTAYAARGSIQRPPRVASAGGAVVALVALAAGVLPHPSQGAHPVVPSEQRVVGGTPRPSPVQDRAWGMAPVDGAVLSADARRSP